MHRRRRTALLTVSAALVAAPLLTACGGEAHPGAAALVGGQRIETTALQAQVRDVRAAQEASPQAAELISATGDLSRVKLNGMIIDRVVEKAAADAGVDATRKEVQEARAAAAQAYGGEQAYAAMLLQQRGVAPDEIDGAVRRDILVNKVAEKHGFPNTPEGQQQFMELLSAASEALDIDVNPRYGEWDDERIQLGTYEAPWIRQLSLDPVNGPEGL
ncbi:SurA N-terminal domain-containing protein [Streptomyces sp. MUM 203J]|uniref:SurA N-terminal domain-containing protein n=1 Tax=Streptomyces sp. MUM 203J TaxID=2791990 RepID=UPI001F04DFA9|nr:SurA N-terminal domain-containing protein [Streptomyces sp. MUM 203J]MCH0538351.1 SurA N-terminal domain-containing protein [Streptomyces sp. MUM 203J]